MKFLKLIEAYRVCEGYRISNDALVCYLNNRCKLWSGFISESDLSSPLLTDVLTRRYGFTKSFCSTSGRFVYCGDGGNGSSNRGNRIVVVDLF